MADKVEKFDFAVIGGGSGGLAAAKKAAQFGAKVCLFDYVVPSPQGSKWGLGGTCVNVGCIPKKLMHYASVIGTNIKNDASKFGWNVQVNHTVDWNVLVQSVQNYVKSLNFTYRNGLRASNVKYINSFARFMSSNEVVYKIKDQEHTIQASHFLIACGGRPHIPADVEGAVECSITSDDIFSLKKPPGKTLIVGASYIALECAGFLTELGFDVTVAVRSRVLRGFDDQCSEKIASLMEMMGTKFMYKVTPEWMKKLEDGRVQVKLHGHVDPQEYDTVLYATGRKADTRNLGLEAAGVVVNAEGKLEVSQNESTNIPNIHAVGDVIAGRPELTPVAIKAGEKLACRLFGGSNDMMDYSNIATTVFTPMEYGCVGLSEEQAISKYGSENVEVYLREFNSLELSAAHRPKCVATRRDEFDTDIEQHCLSKLVCLSSEGMKVVGFHYVGPNAGEITQGMALAIRLNATKADFDECIGIHPTDAESFCSLDVTKRSGESWVVSGGCGGGKCG